MRLVNKPYRILQISLENFEKDPGGWFCKQNTGVKAWLLVHADDGIIWGEIRGGQLITAREIFGEKAAPLLRAQTIQQARLFGPEAEIRVWREENSFRACRIEDEPGGKMESFDEDHFLWGTKCLEQRNGFTRVAEGARGFVQAVPLVVPDEAFDAEASALRHGHHPLRLGVRHYIEYDPDGQAYISLSRLTGIWYEKIGG
ncbi:MAG: TIGR03984 family CRISPR-associated protein [Armatimonadetes bacterium]|nr:TIGR03984 family CRISPR-associated protein [Armatimonadota bacterium]